MSKLSRLKANEAIVNEIVDKFNKYYTNSKNKLKLGFQLKYRLFGACPKLYYFIRLLYSFYLRK